MDIRAFSVLSRIYAGWMPSRRHLCACSRHEASPFLKNKGAWEEWRRDEGRWICTGVAVSPSLLMRAFTRQRVRHTQVASSYLHAPLISSSLSTVGGHSSFRAPCSVFRPIVAHQTTWIPNVDRVFPLERDLLSTLAKQLASCLASSSTETWIVVRWFFEGYHE